jgi:LacI family transcriptional regulator
VLCGRPPLGLNLPTTVVEYDNEGGAYAITSHLLSAGHRKIVFLGVVDPQHTTSAERVSGFVRAHQAYGITPEPDAIIAGDFTREFGYEETRRLLARGAEFTAVFAATDMVAAGTMQALREAGRDVPRDVSVVGYDDIPLARDLYPALTTVHVPHEELGRTAVRLALQRDEHGSGQHVVLGTHVVRDSVAPVVPRL